MKVYALAIISTLAGNACAKYMRNDELAAEGLQTLKAYIAQHGYVDPEKCTLENAAVRREWSTLSEPEKLNYIDAVKCLGKKPAKTPAAISSGARSRYDDFVVTHILQSLMIHGTGNFLTWHRYYIWAYEQALRDECGYKGYLPYNNWAWWSDNLVKSPLFDGSNTSMSGDGEYIPGRKAYCLPNADICNVLLQPSNGGGCVESGPLKDWVVNLGPCKTEVENIAPNPQADCLGYNPRCISRDLSPQAAYDTRDEAVASLITNFTTIFTFQPQMEQSFPGYLGVHSGGHYLIGGDAGSDFMNSPSDPAFWFHHGMIDRVWWTWQNLDFEKREKALVGTLTAFNDPPTRNATLEDVITLGFVGVPNVTISDATNTLAGPFCYVYA